MRKDKNYTPMAYRKGNTLLHRFPAGFKLIFLLLLSLAAFFPGSDLGNFLVLEVITLIMVLLSFIARIGPLSLLKGSGPLLSIVIAALLIRGIEVSPLAFSIVGFRHALIFCIRIALAFSIGSLFFAVTTVGEVRKSISRGEAALGIEKAALSLHFSLMLGFLPAIFEIWEELSLAYKSRSGRRGVSLLYFILPKLIERMIKRAGDTALAMEARGVHV